MKTETRKLLKFITSCHCVLVFFLKQPPREIKTKFTFSFADFLDSCLERVLRLNTNLTTVLELHHSRHLNVARSQKNCTTVSVASDGNLTRKLQSLSDTSAGKTCRHFDCLSCC